MRFVAAYPITPATELLEWMAPALTRVGGTLLQAEDELASINMIIGASYGGVPSLTATAGPGLSLMTEAIGLAVTAEVPIEGIDVILQLGTEFLDGQGDALPSTTSTTEPT